jgi:hypothetical protein
MRSRTRRTEIVFVLQVANAVAVDELIPRVVGSSGHHAGRGLVEAVARELEHVRSRGRRVGADDEFVRVAEHRLSDPVHELDAGHDLVLHAEGEPEFEVAALLHDEASLLHLGDALRGVQVEDNCRASRCGNTHVKPRCKNQHDNKATMVSRTIRHVFLEDDTEFGHDDAAGVIRITEVAVGSSAEQLLL